VNYFNYKITLLVFSLKSFLCTQEKLHVKNSKKPNFLFVLVDDQPFDAIGYSKRYPFLSTPNMDRLKREGTIIKNFFVTQSICSPSKASFFTGIFGFLF
jgi:N-acetylglucosamine-6-sulfatase